MDRDKIPVEKICNDCGTTIITNSGYVRRVKDDHIWRCRECMKTHRSITQKESPTNIGNIIKNMLSDDNVKKCYSEILSKRAKKIWSQRSNEYKQEHLVKMSNGLQKYYSDMNYTERKLRAVQRAARSKRYYATRTLEESAAHRKKLSASRKHYFSRMSEEERLAYSEIYRKAWENASQETKESHRIAGRINGLKAWNMLSEIDKKLRIQALVSAKKKWWNSLDEKTRANRIQVMVDNLRRYWNSMSPGEYERLAYNRSIGYNSYLKKIDEIPNHNEISFINVLGEIRYRYQYYSSKVHPDFYEKFPMNPITKSTFVSPYHQWDFIIYNRHLGNILVDVDGSIHCSELTNFEVTHHSGIKFKLSDFIAFNDSKRPYQTDGLDAYIIECYDDNLKGSTPVLNVITGKKVPFETFLYQLSRGAVIDNMNNREMKKLMRGV